MAKAKTESSASPTKKLLIWVGGALVVIILLAIISSALGGGEDGTEVDVADAEVRTITQKVTASGQVRPEVEVAISSDVSGEIVFLGVEEGDDVQRGQLLVRVQPDFYASQREQAQAGVLQAQADLERARGDVTRADIEIRRAQMEFDRVSNLVEQGAVGRAELDAARVALENANAAREIALANQSAAQYRVQSSQATLRQASQQLGKTNIYAPISGTVSQLNVELGERVVGTAQMTGTEIMRIAELDQMLLEVDVNENDVVNIELSDSARIEIDAFPENALTGLVSQIANSARVSGLGTQEQVTNFPVEIRIGATELPVESNGDMTVTTASSVEASSAASSMPVLRPGMSGTVDIFTQTVERVIAVPIQAVTFRDFNEVRRDELRQRRRDGEDVESELEALSDEEDLRRVVFVVVDGMTELREVQTGIQDETHIEILSGVSEGESVVIGPFRVLRTGLDDGDAVTVRESDFIRTGGEDE
ncbi:MAG: efflux RND transporter periplasmic adaptor subunit [Rubricoccaceae bacterium]|nr:efflux RND transporter periplasmic adaptor subunit [Rubricoccaceae bacterium]